MQIPFLRVDVSLEGSGFSMKTEKNESHKKKNVEKVGNHQFRYHQISKTSNNMQMSTRYESTKMG